VLATRWYLRHRFSYRDVEELLAEHGIDVDHVPIRQGVRRFTPILAETDLCTRHATGPRCRSMRLTSRLPEVSDTSVGPWRHPTRLACQAAALVELFLVVVGKGMCSL
jgi:hypothetical protein